MAGGPGSAAGFALCPRSYLCFESSKSGSSKRNKVIRLVDITDIQKVGAPRCAVRPAPFAGKPPGRRAGGCSWNPCPRRRVPPGDAAGAAPAPSGPARRPCRALRSVCPGARPRPLPLGLRLASSQMGRQHREVGQAGRA